MMTNIERRRVVSVLIFTLALACQTAAADLFSKQAPIYRAEPIVVPAGKTARQVAGAIKRSLLARDWKIRAAEASRLSASYEKSKSWRTSIVITYDAKSVRIAYEGSDGLNYQRDAETIHKSYNELVRLLENTIRIQLQN